MNSHITTSDTNIGSVAVGTPALAPYASGLDGSRGRKIAEPASATRTEFQRDRDRIIHSGAFRKLRNKTQVFIESEGDYYRTRLTHSLEVSQIARSIARALGLNEDLTETLALAHDLGHACFGHAGELALSEAMQPYGGFSHNEQTFRILTLLERHYLDFDGLNLTWETLEGVVKHNGPLLPETIDNKLPATIAAFNQDFDLSLETFAGPEAQAAALADDIAYNTHDIDDGYRAGFFSLQDLESVPLFGPILEDMRRHYPSADQGRIMHAVVRQVIGTMIMDLLDTTRAALMVLRPQNADDIRHAAQPTIRLSFAMQQNEQVLRNFLRQRMYNHSSVKNACEKATKIVQEMFSCLMDKPELLPRDWYEQLQASGKEHDSAICARVIADYIAGMTDRFAVREHGRLLGVRI